MVLIATGLEDAPPPPPPKKRRQSDPNSDPVAMAGKLPLFQRRHLKVTLWPGFMVVITGVWMTRPRWRRWCLRGASAGWYPWEFGFIVVAIRVEF